MGRQRFNFWLDDDLREGLKAVRDREGIVESEQIRRAIRAWLKKKHANEKPAKAPAPARRRA
jgi:hypothetical protein